MNKIHYSKLCDPNKWDVGPSFYCPRWLQPLVMWILIKFFGAKEIGTK